MYQVHYVCYVHLLHILCALSILGILCVLCVRRILCMLCILCLLCIRCCILLILRILGRLRMCIMHTVCTMRTTMSTSHPMYTTFLGSLHFTEGPKGKRVWFVRVLFSEKKRKPKGGPIISGLPSDPPQKTELLVGRKETTTKH